MTSSNPNVNAIQQGIQTLSAKVDTVLQGFEARVLRVETRLDKMELIQRDDLRSMAEHLQAAERRILDKLETSATDLKQAELRLNTKIEEHQTNTGNRALMILLTIGGWLVALAQFIFSYLHPH